MENENDNRYSRLLYAGFSLIAVTIAAGVIIYHVYPHIFELVAFIASLTGAVGIALIIIALIESRHLATALEETSSKIINRSSSILDTKFKDTFDILEHARRTGLADILPPRQDEARASETHIAIADDIKRSSKLFVSCISGLDFFAPPSGARTHAGVFYRTLWSRIEDSEEHNRALNLIMKVLFLDPKSPAGELRNSIEALNGCTADVGEDHSMALAGISRLNNHAKNTFIHYKLYSESPMNWFVITDSFLFIEPYHFAPTEQLSAALQGAGLSASGLDSTCTGGRIPVLQFQSKSNAYIAMFLHFESTWATLGEQSNQ